MKHVPYFQSKHKVIFLIFVALTALVSGLFIVAVIVGMGVKGPLKDDPVENAILFLLTIFAVLLMLYSVIFIIDLMVYFIKKGKALREAKYQNEPVVQEEIKPISAPTNSEEKVVEGQPQEEGLVYDFKETHNPSFKKSFITMTFVNGPAVIILGLLIALIVFIIVAACNITHDVPTILIRCAIGVGITIVVVLLLHILTISTDYKNNKKLKPIDMGTRVYADYMESYMDIDQDINNTHVKSTLNVKVDFSTRVRTKETKKYYIVDQIINKKLAVMVFDKNEVPEEAIKYIKSKLKK